MSAKHKLLEQIRNEVMGIPMTETVTVAGHRFVIKLLTRGEEYAAKALIPEGTNLVQLMTDTGLPALAMALQSVDGVSIEELFGALPEDMKPEERQRLLDDPIQRQRWTRTQVMDWLGSLPGPCTFGLSAAYTDLTLKAKAALENISPLSTTTHSSM